MKKQQNEFNKRAIYAKWFAVTSAEFAVLGTTPALTCHILMTPQRTVLQIFLISNTGVRVSRISQRIVIQRELLFFSLKLLHISSWHHGSQRKPANNYRYEMFNAVKFEVKNRLVFYKFQSLENKNWNL